MESSDDAPYPDHQPADAQHVAPGGQVVSDARGQAGDSREARASTRYAHRGGLGRGLGALIPQGRPGLLDLAVDQITPNPEQPRLRIDEAGLAELADSVSQHGLLQPVVVARAEGTGNSYVLIAGERRWRAAQLAGLPTIPAIVKEAAPPERLELALVENVQREDLSPLEMAAAYRSLIDEHSITQEQLAQRLGKSRVSVANTLRLLHLPRPAMEALAGGSITEGHARALLGVPDEAALLNALAEVLHRGLSVRDTEELARRLGQEPARRREAGASEEPGRPRRSDTETAYLEESFRQALGTKVQLVRSRRGGRLVIHFYSDEELQGIQRAICGD